MESISITSLRKNFPIKENVKGLNFSKALSNGIFSILTRHRSRLFWIPVILFILTVCLASEAEGRFITLDVPPDWGLNTRIIGINYVGQIVGSYEDSNQQNHYFLYSSGHFSHILDMGYIITGINDFGVMVGETSLLNTGAIFSNGGVTPIIDNSFATCGGTAIMITSGINKSGQVVGWSDLPVNPPAGCNGHSFIYSGGNFTYFEPHWDNYWLDFPYLTGINNAGQVIGYYQGFGFQPFIISNGTIQNLNITNQLFLPDAGILINSFYPTGINDSGKIVGPVCGVCKYGILYVGGNITLIPPASWDLYYYINIFINNADQIIGTYRDNSLKFHGFIQTDTNLLDPVPGLLTDLANKNFPSLAVNGPEVEGIAADGVAEVLIRIPAAIGESFTLSLMDDQGTISNTADEDGCLHKIGDTSCTSNVQVVAESVSNAPNPAYGFVLYRAPKDFVRPNNSTDAGLDHRTVALQIQVNSEMSLLPVPIKIVRPPVILIHGIWGYPESWDLFRDLLDNNSANFYVQVVNYRSTNYLGFEYNAKKVLSQVRTDIPLFKAARNVAAVQVDIVAHSMGGDISRYFYLLRTFFRDQNYGQGDVHKLITLDTPHNGSPLATNLYNSSTSCHLLWWFKDHAISDAVGDLRPGSDALERIGSIYPNPVHPKVYLISGTANSNQIYTVERNYRLGSDDLGYLRYACPDLLSDRFGNFIGFDGVLGATDLIVPESSQLALSPNLSIDGNPIPSTGLSGYIHSTDLLLFTTGPDILNRNYSFTTQTIVQADNVTPQLVIGLLNAPVYVNGIFGSIAP